MSLPKRLYENYRAIQKCGLIQKDVFNDEDILEFEQLLNNAQPRDDIEAAQQYVIKGMFYSNQKGFIRYISNRQNRVGGLILWTESKRIAAYFNLMGRVHIGWDKVTSSYKVTLHNIMLGPTVVVQPEFSPEFSSELFNKSDDKSDDNPCEQQPNAHPTKPPLRNNKMEYQYPTLQATNTDQLV